MGYNDASLGIYKITEVRFMAGPTGFEPAIFSVTGRRDRPLHYEPKTL